MPDGSSIFQIAYDLIEQHGNKAGQKVVDGMALAIRNHDLAAAKQWEEVGCSVDRQLAAR